MNFLRRIAAGIHAIFTTSPSVETIRRVKRTFWQVLASNTVVTVALAQVTNDAKALVQSSLLLVGTVFASYATNVLEDADVKKDRR